MPFFQASSLSFAFSLRFFAVHFISGKGCGSLGVIICVPYFWTFMTSSIGAWSLSRRSQRILQLVISGKAALLARTVSILVLPFPSTPSSGGPFALVLKVCCSPSPKAEGTSTSIPLLIRPVMAGDYCGLMLKSPHKRYGVSPASSSLNSAVLIKSSLRRNLSPSLATPS